MWEDSQQKKQIERIKPVLEALPSTRLALVGDGPYRQQLEKIFQGTSTTFVGYLSGNELASAYASGDAFFIPLKHRDPGISSVGGNGCWMPSRRSE